ncbi:MAG: PAS domain S-box protein [Microscillaceae bacterium]|nr:PAS domain S-box protein [Microscillaceae bacterium]
MAEEKLNQELPDLKEMDKLVEAVENHTESKNGISFQEYEALKRGFIEERKQLEDRMWLDAHLNKFDDVIRQNFDSSLASFSEKVTHQLAKATNAVYGAFFVANQEEKYLDAVAGYACTPASMDRSRFSFGEGLIGQVAKSKEILCLDNIETQLDSSIGRINACYLVVVPLIFNDTVYGIIELNSLTRLGPRYLTLIKRAALNIATALQSIINNQKTKKLLIESLQQFEDLKAQKLELEQKEAELKQIQWQLHQKELELEKAHNAMNLSIKPEPQTLTPSHELTHTQKETLDTLQTELQLTQQKLHEKGEEILEILDRSKNSELLARQFEEKLTEKMNQLEHYKTLNSDLELIKKELHKTQESLKTKEKELEEYVMKTSSGQGDQGEGLQLLQKQIQEKEDQILSLEYINQQLEKDFQRKVKEIDMFRETIKWKDAEIDRQDEAIIEKKKELRFAKEQIEEIKNENLKNLAEIVRQGKAIELKEKEIQELKSSLSSIPERQITDISPEILAQKEQEFDTIKAELLSRHENQIKEKEQELILIKKELNRQQEESQQFHKAIEQLHVELKTKDHSLISLEEELKTKQDNLQRSQEEIRNIQALLRKKEDELLVSQYLLNQKGDGEGNPMETDSIRKELEDSRRLLALKEIELNNLKTELQNGQKISEEHPLIQELQNELLEKNTQLNALMQKVKAQEDEIVQAQDKISVYTTTSQDVVENLKSLLTQREQELEQVKARLDQLQQTDWQQIVQQLQKQISEKQEEINLLKSRPTPTEITSDDEKVQKLVQLLQEKEKELEQKKANNQLQVEALASLKTELSIKEKALADFKEQMQNHILQTNTSEEVEKLIAELRDKEKETLQQAEALNHLRNQLLEKEKKIESLKQNSFSQEGVSGEERDDFYKKLDELEGIQKNLDTKEKEILSQSDLIRKQKNELLLKQQELEAIKDELKEKESENAKQAEKIQSQEHQLEVKQNEMKQKEKELASLFNKINTAFAALEFDMEGNVLSINNKFLMLLGLKVEDVEGNPYEKLISPEYAESTPYKILWQGLKMGASQNVENIICIGNKGKQVKMNVTYIPIIGEEGRPYEVVKLVNNIIKTEEEIPVTFQKNNQENTPNENKSGNTELSIEDQEKLRAVNNSFVIAELDLDGNILSVNKQFLTFLGYEESEVVGKHHKNFVDITERSSEPYATIVKGFATGGFASEILKYVGKEGERVRLRSYFNPILDENQNPMKVLVISQFVN